VVADGGTPTARPATADPIRRSARVARLWDNPARQGLASSQRGQAAVEAALMALVLIVTLIGIFDMGQIFFIHQTLVERVRNAGRYSAVHNYDPARFINMVLYNQATVPPDRTSGIFGLTPSMVDVVRRDAGTSEDRIVLTLRDYPFRFFTPIIGRAFTGRPIVVSFPYEAP
jgi:hypothetical protein